MNTKSCLAATLLLCTTLAVSIELNEKTFQKEADAWVADHIWNEQKGLMVPQEDLQLITNLCYFSFHRSYATLKAQENALALLSSLWNGWQNITHTRLDPSKDTPHVIEEKEKQLSSAEFWDLHDQHRVYGQTYAHAVDIVVDSDALTTVKALNAVKTLRSESRAVVAEALVSVRKLLGKLFHNPTKKSAPLQKGFELLNYLWDYIPQLALLSFTEADKLNNKVSEDGWAVLHTIQDVSTRTWQAIEEGRASFYLARYNALAAVFEHTGIAGHVLFDQHGLILAPDDTQLLEMPILGS